MAPVNILYLHSHDVGRFVQPYGYPVATPNLQKFAKESILFRKGFSAAPTCGPSRTALLTGQYPHEVGMLGLPGRQGWRVDDYSKHLVHVLNAEGYMTALTGCQHEADHQDISPLGYQRFLDGPEERGQDRPETVHRAIRFLAEDHSDKPFFLSVGIDEPHRDNREIPELRIPGDNRRFSHTVYYDPETLDNRYVAPPPFLPDHPEIRRDMASFQRGVRIMDDRMGQVLNALQQYGLAKNTLVIITTDHGIGFPHAKLTLTDQGIGVMLMVRGPGGFTGGKVIDSLVSQIDLYPTILDVIGAAQRPWLRGRSLLPLMGGRQTSIREEIFAEQTYHGKAEPLRCIRTERYKLVKRHFPTGPKLRSQNPSNAVMDSAGWLERPLGHEELFDLMLDPMEACNRVNDPAYVNIAADLRQRLDHWMQETGDFFLSGSIPPVPGRIEKDSTVNEYRDGD